jgi:hypothetical protein
MVTKENQRFLLVYNVMNDIVTRSDAIIELCATVFNITICSILKDKFHKTSLEARIQD